jgi:hypothetical protein
MQNDMCRSVKCCGWHVAAPGNLAHALITLSYAPVVTYPPTYPSAAAGAGPGPQSMSGVPGAWNFEQRAPFHLSEHSTFVCVEGGRGGGEGGQMEACIRTSTMVASPPATSSSRKTTPCNLPCHIQKCACLPHPLLVHACVIAVSCAVQQ